MAGLLNPRNLTFEIRDPDLVYTHGIFIIFRSNLNYIWVVILNPRNVRFGLRDSDLIEVWDICSNYK